MTAASQPTTAASTPSVSGVEFFDADALSADKPSSSKGWRSAGGRAVIDAHASKPLVKAIVAGRETQRHPECLTRQIVSRARRQATTVKARSRARRRSSLRIYYQELVDRLTFERWVELDMIVCRLAMQEQVIGELRHREKRPVRHQAA